MDLPSDIWQIIGENYMEGTDILHLSSTCRHIRSCLVSLVFRKITFRGSTRHSVQSLGNHFAYLLSVQSRIEALKKEPNLAFFVKHAVICNWVEIPTFLASGNTNTCAPTLGKHRAAIVSQHTSSLLAYKLISIWSEVYAALLGLLKGFSNIKTITFSEYIERNAWQTQKYHYFEDSLDADCLGIYSMLEFTVPNNIFQVEVLIPPSFNISQDEHIVRLPTTTSYLLEILALCTSLRLTAAKFDGEMLYASYPSILPRLSSLKKLGVSNVPYWYTHIIAELVNLCTELVQLEVLGHDDVQFSIPTDKLPKLRSLTGSMPFLQRAIEGRRIIEKIYLRDDAYRIPNVLFHNPMLASHLHFLDISTIGPATPELLDSLAKTWPNLKYLSISHLSTTLLPGSPQTLLFKLLQGAAPFHMLEGLRVTKGQILSASSPHTVNIQTWDGCSRLREIRVTDRGIYLYHFAFEWCYQQMAPCGRTQYVTVTPGFLQLMRELSSTIPSKELRVFRLNSFVAVPQGVSDKQRQQESLGMFHQRKSAKVLISFTKIWGRFWNKFKG